MFARTTRGQDRSNGGRLLRVENVVSGSTSAISIEDYFFVIPYCDRS